MPSPLLISQRILEPLAGYLSAINPQLLEDGEWRTAHRSIHDAHGDPYVLANKLVPLFEKLADDLGNPAFGLDYAKSFPLGGTGAFGYVLSHSKDMRSAVLAIARYTRIIMPAVDVRYERIEDGGHLSWSYPLELSSPNIQFNSFVAALVVLRLRNMLSPGWYPKGVELAHREPGAHVKYSALFGPGLHYDRPANRFTFCDANLDRGNQSADPRLFAVVKQLADILLQFQTTGVDFRAAVSNAIVRVLGVDAPSLNAVSEHMALGARTVQRRLANEGTSFEAVLSDTRRRVAERLLRETDLPLTDIAFMLGFSELSAFTRAGKRWHGMPPRQFRVVHRGAT